MIAFLSPAKSLNFESDLTTGNITTPAFLDASETINKALQRKSKKKLVDMQSISENLADLNYQRNKDWDKNHTLKNSRQAALAFDGDVYQGLQAEGWSAKDMDFAENHLRILSGLYGVLKPTDLIQPYRLEMGTKLKLGRKENLYKYWQANLSAYLKELGDDEILLNLASKEYFKAVETANPSNRIVNAEFYDYSKGRFKIISFFAKKARGLMANYVVKNRICKVEDLKDFDVDGYYFHKTDSTEQQLVFHRKQ